MILVVGATGLLGGRITQQLLAQGRNVRILVRHNSPSVALAAQGMATHAQTLIDAGAQPVYGDLKDPTSLPAAMAGVDTVVTTANSALRGGADNPETVERQGNRHLIDAAKDAGVGHFIFVSVMDADPNSPAPFVRGKAETEAYLRASGLSYTILAPNAFLEVWLGMVIGAPLKAGQPITLVGEAQRKHAFVSMKDVTAFAVTAITHPAARNATIVIGGREALSWCDLVSGVEAVLQRKLPVRFVVPGEPVPFVPEAVQGLFARMETYDSPVPMDDVVATYGVTLTPLQPLLQGMFGAS
jgi:NADH dehydrogenase